MWRLTKCTSAPLLRAEARRAEHSLGSLINDQRVESLAYSLSIFRGPLCETRQLIHEPNHFKINWFTCTLHFQCVRYRGSLLAGDIHMGILTADMKRIVRGHRLGYIATVCPSRTPNLSPQ